MLPWEKLDAVAIAGGSDELRLMRRGAEYSIMLGTNELMNSRLSGSEQALATLACEKLVGVGAPAVLIGGLGMGFTLRAALDVLPANARVQVAELVPAVVKWARGPMAALFDGCLDDPRARVVEGDVLALIRASKAAFDAILLDVDNGPDGLTRAGNDGLYSSRGLEAARQALKPGGVLTVWSSAPDERFTQRVKAAGFTVEAVPVRAHGKRGARHVIWVAVKGR